MNKIKQVQVIIPYYKEFEYLCEAIESVLVQTFSNFELLIIDDGTRDQRIVQYLQEKNDNRISLIQHSKNIGLSKNFEFARKKITCEFVVFLGQDDSLHKNYLEEMIIIATQNPEGAIFQSRVRVINSLGSPSFHIADLIKKILFSISWSIGRKNKVGAIKFSINSTYTALMVLLLGDYLYFPTILWRTSELQKFDTSLNTALDFKLIIEILVKGGDLILIENNLANYRRHSKSQSMRENQMISRLKEEKCFYNFAESIPFIEQRTLLKVIAQVRLTHRLNALHFFLGSVFRKDYKSALNALKLVI